ncbi:hypothetical protein KIL84_018581 [Mauremys mutica]|uniref:Uncharacterized protein n=1 Tax=Mauremys mutica TaxID=74926 RepID=A0A9D4B2K0_9SAUR|nr:hypothetical protein KIL84_018581 [Mauremys mutica]
MSGRRTDKDSNQEHRGLDKDQEHSWEQELPQHYYVVPNNHKPFQQLLRSIDKVLQIPVDKVQESPHNSWTVYSVQG